MYLDYIQERLGKEVLSNSNGFAIFYNNVPENAIYLEDIYVKPEFRRSNVASEMLKNIEVLAKERNLSYILGSVEVNSVNPEYSLRGMLKYGFKLYAVRDSLIFLRKEV